MKKLNKEMITWISMILIFVVLYFIGGLPFSIGIGLFSILIYKELIDLKLSHSKIPFLVLGIGLVCLLNIMYQNFDGYSLYLGFSYQSICMTLVLLLLPTLIYRKYETKDAFYMIGMVILLGVFFNGVILLENYNKYLLLYLILVALVGDLFAWLIGKLIGVHKLSRTISPNKTVEGAIAGFLMASIVGSTYYGIVIGTENIITVVVMTMLLSVIAQVGDLLFSKIKRENNLKDFESILPIKGGILDYIDSFVILVISYIWLINFF